MESVKGTTLPLLPISGLKRVRDLHYFDGPLLTEYVNSTGENFLFYWCDCDETSNRWMVLRVSEASILRLVNRFVPMDYVIPTRCQDEFVYLVDKPITAAQKTIVRLVSIDDLPQSYKPEQGAYLEPVKSASGSRFFSVLIESEALETGFTHKQLLDFPGFFRKCYSLIYDLKILRLPEFPNFPWRGGFSAVHFFNWAAGIIPAEDRPRVSAMQFASPGFFRFNLNGSMAEEVIKCVKELKESKSIAYNELSSYIRKHELNEITSPNDDRWDGHNSELESMAVDVLKIFSAIDSKQFVAKSPRPFETAKIAMAFYRYVRDLLNYEADGIVKYPEITG